MLWCVVLAASVLAKHRYHLYRPAIQSSLVVNVETSPLQYNHDASIALFKGIWIAVWNGNRVPYEGRAGQFNYMATSKDLQVWTEPEVAFSDGKRAANPIPCNATTCIQVGACLRRL